MIQVLYAAVLTLTAMVLTGCITPHQDYASFTHAPFISPRIIQDLSCWISDQGDQVVAIDLDAQNSNRYAGEPQVKHIQGQNPCVCWQEVTVQEGQTNETQFGYQYVGRTASGIEVLVTSDWGGGSGVFRNLLLLKFEYDYGISCDWDKGVIRAGKERLLIKKVGEIALGDRWNGELRVEGNAILVGKDKGWFTSGGTGGALSAVPKDRWLKIDLETKRPKAKRANDPKT
jgi:hypothetical protein